MSAGSLSATVSSAASGEAKRRSLPLGRSLGGSELDGTEFDGAELDGAELDGVEVNSSKLDGAEVDSGELDGTGGVVLEEADLCARFEDEDGVLPSV